MKIAKDYSDLDSWGKSAVRELVSTEKQRCEDEARFMEDSQLVTFEPKVINRYLEPSAAGIAAPVEGKDFEPYELGPDDPQGAAYAIRVQGDSMEPDFPDGSTVFVKQGVRGSNPRRGTMKKALKLNGFKAFYFFSDSGIVSNVLVVALLHRRELADQVAAVLVRREVVHRLVLQPRPLLELGAIVRVLRTVRAEHQRQLALAAIYAVAV